MFLNEQATSGEGINKWVAKIVQWNPETGGRGKLERNIAGKKDVSEAGMS